MRSKAGTHKKNIGGRYLVIQLVNLRLKMFGIQVYICAPLHLQPMHLIKAQNVTLVCRLFDHQQIRCFDCCSLQDKTC